MKSLEQQLKEKDDELRELRQKVSGSTVSTYLTQELSESGLPEVARARIRKQFQTATKTDGIKEAIAEERDYVRQARAGASRRSAQSDNSPRTVDLVDCYRQFGLSKKEAELAAGVEDSVKNLNESEEKLFDAAKGMGLSELEAEWFVDTNRRTTW